MPALPFIDRPFVRGAGMGMGLGAALVAGGHAIRSHRKKVRQRELLARIRGTRSADAPGRFAGMTREYSSIEERIIAFGQGMIARNAGKIAAGAVATAALGGTAYVAHHLGKQKMWREQAGDKDFLKLGPELVVDRHGAMFPTNHPRVRGGNIRELSALAPGMIEFGERVRNGNGEFAGMQAGEPSPAAMIKTYGEPQGMARGESKGAQLIRSLRKVRK